MSVPTKIPRWVIQPIGLAALGICGLAIIPPAGGTASQSERRWLAGDHHVHSQYSVDWNDSTTPPTPIVAGDARYPIPTNAERAREYGLTWMVSTDHGGPNHSKLNLELAYPELVGSRTSVPELIQFYGMEFDTPGADHSSMIVPHSNREQRTLYDLESQFSKRDAFPRDSTRDTEPRMLEALRHMRGLPEPPVVIANHPSRSATGIGVYGLDTPRELRDWNDTAPQVAVGMEGAPGHQAGAIARDGSRDSTGARGGYRRQPTMGGFDQMTARLGGFWDSMLGEGRRWWITSTSDSHNNWRHGGSDFWPGEYSKTYVFGSRTYHDILDGLRTGRVFVTTGDLVSELHVTAERKGAQGEPAARQSIGGTLTVPPGADVQVTIRLRDPRRPNHHGDTPSVARVDLIAGDVTGPVADRATDTNPTTHVVQRFSIEDWQADGEFRVMSATLRDVRRSGYIRVRGTNTMELEPSPDPSGENPWSDLWFYSNPIFLVVADSSEPDVAVVRETFITPHDTIDNVDSPAVWHGPNGASWLLSTAKTTNAVLVNDAATGVLVRRIGGTGKALGRLQRPNGILATDSLLFVVERDNRRVQVFGLPSLEPLGTFGESVLRMPYGIAAYPEHAGGYTVYVTDNYETENGEVPPMQELDARVKRFRVRLDGRNLRTKLTGSFGDITPAGALQVVESIAVDVPNGRLLIAEELETDSHIKIYSLDGKYAGRDFGRGYFPQQAEGIALYACGDGEGYWLVTDQGEDRNTYHVFDRRSFEHRGSFSGERTRLTDGVALTQRHFGPFRAGAFYASHLDGSVSAFSWLDVATTLRLRSDC